MINEANEPSSACRLWRISQVETGAPPATRPIIADDPTGVKAASWRLWLAPRGHGRRALKLQQIVDDDAEDGQRSLVFKPFGGLVELLERELGVFVHGFVVHQFADGALAAVYFFGDFAEVGHHRSRLFVEGVVFGQFAEGAFAGVDLFFGVVAATDHAL